ncbi:hypothetical protein AGR13a_Lc30114 [Agrobacterium genomosp. 13 str. CFBP 6927]|uniref:Transposase n=1 Tax=Agrobacterium genomosp. 13 str. CFBP 6927 TaxID=1183428 RepID=A0ABP2BQG6_9HYPH|nr:hypothetical protein AGR13a_Lc30114 [Agrobacterium genomosp. 13 str. CFBP 6927]
MTPATVGESTLGVRLALGKFVLATESMAEWAAVGDHAHSRGVTAHHIAGGDFNGRAYAAPSLSHDLARLGERQFYRRRRHLAHRIPTLKSLAELRHIAPSRSLL